MSQNILFPFFHVVSDVNCPHLEGLYPVISIKEFEESLDYLQDNFTPIGISDIVNDNIPESAIHLSFDDGLRQCSQVIAPILEKRGIPATFFINPAFIGNEDMMHRFKENLARKKSDLQDEMVNMNLFYRRLAGRKEVKEYHEFCRAYRPYMEIDDVKSLKSHGFTIGSHSMDHPLFSEITFEEAKVQMDDSYEYIRDVIGEEQSVFAFPFTDANVSKNVKAYASEKFDLVFGTGGIGSKGNYHQRITMERDGFNAKHILKMEMFKYLMKQHLRF